ncbi:ABC transporter permease, partial [bacterium]
PRMRSAQRFFTRWQNWLGILLVVVFVVAAIAAPLLSPNDLKNPGPMKIIGRPTLLQPQAPSQAAPLGTLSNQASVYHALVWGSRSALAFGLSVTIISLFIGAVIGLVSAYFGGFLNNFLMRITDALLSFPIIAGIVLVQQLISIALYNGGIRVFFQGIGLVTSSGGFIYDPAEFPAMMDFLLDLDPVLITLILLSWMPYARIMNTMVLRIKKTEYVQAAQIVGARHGRIIFKHLLPNAITPLIVLAARDVAGMVVLQATFVFIGFGKGSPWATILVSGRDWIYSQGGILTYWWVFVPATLALVAFGIGWNLIGDGLNDALNPRSH